MALSVEIQNEENSFVVSAIITSDNITRLLDKMKTDAFRIDIADKLYALANGGIIKEKLKEAENPSLSPAQRESINEEIADVETIIGTPIISIDKNNYARYMNGDDEHLLENGVQLIVNDSNSMVIRFAPIQNVPFLSGTIGLTILHCVIGFDFDEFEVTNRKAFDVCLFPRLITGNVEKENPSDPDPILPNDVERPGYPFTEDDEHSLYVNNGEKAVVAQKVPVEIVRTSAYTTEEITEFTNNDFIWNTLDSSLVNEAAGTSIKLPFTVNGESDITEIQPVESITAKIINKDDITSPNNTLTGVKVYEIIQKIETSGNQSFLKDNVRLSVDA